MSIDALFAQKKREKMMAKKQQQADTKNKRMAFKQQLEAQSPKVYVQDIIVIRNKLVQLFSLGTIFLHAIRYIQPASEQASAPT